jgi:hypothetical protein
MITPTVQDRNVKIAIVELSKKPNLAYFTLSDGVDIREAWVIVLSLGIVALAAVGGGAAGWLLAVEFWQRPDLSTASTLLAAAVSGLPVGLYVLVRLLEAAAASYEAEMSERPETPTGRSFSRAAVPGRTVPLSEQDKQLLQAFGRRYPVIKSLAVNRYEGNDSPFDFEWLESKRKGIERVQAIVIRMGLGSRDGRGGVTLNTAGEDKVTEWAAGVFDDDDPPSLDGRS